MTKQLTTQEEIIKYVARVFNRVQSGIAQSDLDQSGPYVLVTFGTKVYTIEANFVDGKLHLSFTLDGIHYGYLYPRSSSETDIAEVVRHFARGNIRSMARLRSK